MSTDVCWMATSALTAASVMSHDLGSCASAPGDMKYYAIMELLRINHGVTCYAWGKCCRIIAHQPLLSTAAFTHAKSAPTMRCYIPPYRLISNNYLKY